MALGIGLMTTLSTMTTVMIPTGTTIKILSVGMIWAKVFQIMTLKETLEENKMLNGMIILNILDTLLILLFLQCLG